MQDFRQVQEEYARRLAKAFEVAADAHQIEGVSIRAIDPQAISWFREHWQSHPRRRVHWDWGSPDHRPAKGMNVAIWYADALCGFASGELTSNAVRIDFIERYPGPNPLKGRIIPIALTVGDAYRILTGRNDLRIHDVSEQLVPIYERFGFELAPERGRVHVMRRKKT